MTGKQLVSLLRRPGKVMVPMLLPHDVTHIACEKAGLIEWASELGDQDTGLRISWQENGTTFLDTAN